MFLLELLIVGMEYHVIYLSLECLLSNKSIKIFSYNGESIFECIIMSFSG